MWKEGEERWWWVGEGSYSSVVAVIVEAVDKTLIPNCLGSVGAPHDTLIPTKREGKGGKGGKRESRSA